MRFPAVLGFGLLAICAGTASAGIPVDGNWHLTGTVAYPAPQYVSQPGGDARMVGSNGMSDGALVRKIPLAAWKGQRVRLTLRLKNAGDARVTASAQLDGSEGCIVQQTLSQKDSADGGAWLARFVVDVPQTGADLTAAVNLHGKGAVLVDAMRLEAAGDETPVSHRKRLLENAAVQWRCANALITRG
jgi:hypothetical protein